MFASFTNLFKKIKKIQEGRVNKESAKERLHLVLLQDRANVSADFLEMMKQEIIEVIKKYIDVDEKEIDVKLTNKQNSDGTTGAPALYANIPIIGIKDETRKMSNKLNLEKSNEKKSKDKNNKEKKDKNNSNSDENKVSENVAKTDKKQDKADDNKQEGKAETNKETIKESDSKETNKKESKEENKIVKQEEKSENNLKKEENNKNKKKKKNKKK